MRNRLQKTVSAALGVLAAALIACVILRYSPADAGGELSFGPAELAEVTDYGLVDLNRASEEELRALPGIGEVLAERIVTYREENGGFHAPEDILAVQGIGEGTYEKIAPYITY